MHRTIAYFAVVCSLTVSAVAAEEAKEKPAAPTEQEWLRQLAGEWDSVGEAVAAPGMPAMECKGTMKFRMLGEHWLISDVTGDIGGTQFTAIQTVGWDAKSRKYIGTWVDSMMNHMWKYSGSVDESGKILALDAEGPDFSNPEKTAMYRDAYELKSKDHIVMTSAVQGADGKWTVFMTSNLRRKK